MDKPQNEHTGEINISGISNSQIAIGPGNTQSQSFQVVNAQVTQADLQALHALIEDLKQQVTATATPELKDKAIERASELELAITAPKADLTTMEYVRNWFIKTLPQLAGAVSALVVHPIVGKIVEVSGEAIASEFKRKFGIL
ncbi:MAG: hypothetical protein ACM3XO_00280 [Bacteroidota bacterium]